MYFQANPDEFLHLFIRNNTGIMDFLEYMVKSRPNECSELVYNTLLEQYLHHYKNLDPKVNCFSNNFTNTILGIC
jgi:hypothetical protein